MPVSWFDFLLSGACDIDSLNNRDEPLIEKVTQLMERPLSAYHRSRVTGLDHVPEGPCLYVGNHNAGIYTPDTWLFCGAVYREHGLSAVPYGLGHEVAIRLKGACGPLVKLGAVRASHDNAHRLFEAGHKALVYPGGDVESMRPFAMRNRIVFGGRQGYIRLALRERVPVVPVVTAGAHACFVVLSDNRWLAKMLGLDRSIRMKIMPLTFALPWGLWLGFPPPYLPLPVRIFIEIMEPIRFERDGPEASEDPEYVAQCASHVQAMMQTTMDRLVQQRMR